MTSFRVSTWLAPIALAGAVAVAACGSGDNGSGFDPTQQQNPDGGGPADDSGSIVGNGRTVTSITIDPPSATIEVLNGAPARQPFKVTARYSDNSSGPLTTGISWKATNFQVGGIDGAGIYNASRSVGGIVTVSAGYQSVKASAQLTVKLHIKTNTGGIPGGTQTTLTGATAPDTTCVWAYPYDGTVFPRGLLAAPLMWNNGAATDAYYVHLTSPTFEYENFTAAPPPSSYAFDATHWQQFVDSTDGGASLKVNRFDGTKATVVANHKWTIAPASMRGTIYYWANNKGRVMRVKPGAGTPDDFSDATFQAAIAAGQLPSAGCTMTCHTVSADGSTLVSGGDSLGGTYNLLTNKITYDTGGAAGSAQKRFWAMPALSPTGKYVVQNSSPLPGPPGGSDGLFNSTTGARVAGSGLDGKHLGMPAFAPDGTLLAHVNVANGALSVYDFNQATGVAANERELVQQGAAPAGAIEFPSVTPDAKWIIYHRGPNDTRNGPGDLFLASATAANQEIRLAAVNGDTYPFAAGARDKSLNYEPTFAPVAAGGYFWTVFTTRRTYGNVLTGDKTVVKQLWVAAIDQTPTPGKDPSHPAFRLPGQDIASVNMRGFWALDPCKGDGQGCASGTECCGGYCDASGDAGAAVCKSQQTACAQNGDKCQASSDCCNAGVGVTCINHVCSEPTPK